jgi:hypothetical protein
MQLIRLERISKRLGEDLVAERLHDQGFTEVENLNLRRNNYPFGDLLATYYSQCGFGPRGPRKDVLDQIHHDEKRKGRPDITYVSHRVSGLACNALSQRTL